MSFRMKRGNTMSSVIITIFYLYYIVSLNIYRKEIQFRFLHYNQITGKWKAPMSLKKSVLFCCSIFLFNLIFQLILSANILVLLHFFPVGICVNHLHRLQKRIIKLDKQINMKEE